MQGHNVAGECREAATLQMSRTETETLLSELTRMHHSLTTCKEAAKWRHAAEFAVQLRTLLSRMLAWLVRQIGSAHLPYTMVSPCDRSPVPCVGCWPGSCVRSGRPTCPTSWWATMIVLPSPVSHAGLARRSVWDSSPALHHGGQLWSYSHPLSRMLAWLVRQLGSAHLPYNMVSPCDHTPIACIACWPGSYVRFVRSICPPPW